MPDTSALRRDILQASFGDVHRECNRICWSLKSLAIVPRRPVLLLWLPRNKLQAMALALALLRTGVPFVAMDPRAFGIVKLFHAFRTLHIQAVIVPSRIGWLVRVTLWFVRVFATQPRVVIGEALSGGARCDDYAEEAVEASDVAYIANTGGSTGPAKLVITTHGNLAKQLALYEYEMGQTNPYISFHLYLNFAVPDLLLGGCVLLPNVDSANPRRVSPAHICHLIAQFQPQIVTFPLCVWERVIELCSRTNTRLTSVACAFVGGCEVPPAFHRRACTILSEGVPLVSSYGCTEALPICNQASSDFSTADLRRTHRGHGTLYSIASAPTCMRVHKHTVHARTLACAPCRDLPFSHPAGRPLPSPAASRVAGSSLPHPKP